VTTLADIFGQHGPLARALPGYSMRDEQIAMSEHVAAALDDREALIVEAGTGTGKTFAYLIPALVSGRRVIVSTGTKALQDQLFHRDLPVVSAALGRPVRVALLKGRANYLCRHRLELAEQPGTVPRSSMPALRKVRSWSFTTRSGDVAELPSLAEQDPVWPWVTSTRENCLGTDCPRIDDCFVLAARREAQAADIVVVNHYLLMADMMLKEEGFGDLLPGADAIVIDEAHQLPDIAAQFLGFSVGTRQATSIVKDVAAELLLVHQMGTKVDALLTAFDAQAAAVVAAATGLGERVEFESWTDRLIESLNGLAARAAELSQALAPLADDGSAGMGRLVERLTDFVERLVSITGDELPEGVRWIEIGARNVTAHYAPVDVAGQLAALMENQASAWVMTSATLAVGDDFSHFKRRSGMKQARTQRFESPFDFANQALLYLPEGLGDPGAPRHTSDVIAAALSVLEVSGGRAFLLFTSHRALREASDLLFRAWGPKPPVPIMVQGDAPRDRLLREFREAGNAVLLGTGTFWEGVDVKGPALSVVIIDKLPFAAPDDPLLKARLAAIREQGGNPFFDEQVPQAVIALKQGVGRLIRDPADFGVVMLCDTRLVTKGYGRAFLDSLPPMRRTRKLETVQSFLREKLGDR
jgi:ATP-dependent DNA helicase DinG